MSLFTLLICLVSLLKYAHSQYAEAYAYFNHTFGEYPNNVTNNRTFYGNVSLINGEVTVYLDFSQVDIVEDLGLAADCVSSGLKYHVHTEWNHNDSYSRLGASACSGTMTSLHYDPFNGCGGATANQLCINQGGCLPASMTYDSSNAYVCSESMYEDDPFVCEIGDWSGKYGSLYMDDYDIIYRVDSSFGEFMGSAVEGMSVVFHCGNGDRAFCAPFEIEGEDSDLTPPAAYQETGYELKADFTDVFGGSDSNFVRLRYDGLNEIEFDFSDYSGTCTDDKLNLWIYDSWDIDYVSALESAECTSAIIGDIYDPIAQCPPNSNNSYCGSCITSDYNCSYETDEFSCALADVSGRWTEILITDTNYAIIGYNPYLAPLHEIVGGSIVVTCDSDSSIVACASLLDVGKSRATAYFSPENSGVDGTIILRDGRVTIDLDFSNINISNLPAADCLDYGLQPHIHELWEYGAGDEIDKYYPYCHPNFTGYHFDPWLACSENSANPDCDCKDEADYACDLDADPYTCEVGDWSSKYGDYMINAAGRSLRTDAHWLEVDGTDVIGTSVILHCAGGSMAGARAFCAPWIVEGNDGSKEEPVETQEDNVGLIDYVYVDLSSVSESGTDYMRFYSNGYYDVNVVFTDSFTSTAASACPNSNLLYRIYSSWTSNNDIETSSCSSYVGDVFDPTSSCLYGSTSPDCIGGSRCGSGNNYTCDWSGTADRYFCSPCDLSGKYGSLDTSESPISLRVWGYDDLMVNLLDLEDKSVAVMCESDMSMVACAKIQFEYKDTTTAEPTPSTTEGVTTESPDSSAYGFSISTFIFIIAFIGIFIN